MKHVGLCSVLLACCISAQAWGTSPDEKEAPAAVKSVSDSAVPVEVIDDQNYTPWQVYGYAGAYDHSAVATYNAWPQVCIDGLWDNYCNERHCHCYQGPKHHGGCHGCKHGHLGQRRKSWNENVSVGVPCSSGDCVGPGTETMMEAEPALQPQPVPEPPVATEASAPSLPRINPIRSSQKLPVRWRSER